MNHRVAEWGVVDSRVRGSDGVFQSRALEKLHQFPVTPAHAGVHAHHRRLRYSLKYTTWCVLHSRCPFSLHSRAVWSKKPLRNAWARACPSVQP